MTWLLGLRAIGAPVRAHSFGAKLDSPCRDGGARHGGQRRARAACGAPRPPAHTTLQPHRSLPRKPQARFAEAAEFVKTFKPSKTVPNEEKLRAYGARAARAGVAARARAPPARWRTSARSRWRDCCGASRLRRPPSHPARTPPAALYKQATVGDCNIPRPGGFLNFEANAKWDAWHALVGVSKEEAMRRYVEAIESQKAEYA